jgi:hypothetical protein
MRGCEYRFGRGKWREEDESTYVGPVLLDGVGDRGELALEDGVVSVDIAI